MLKRLLITICFIIPCFIIFSMLSSCGRENKNIDQNSAEIENKNKKELTAATKLFEETFNFSIMERTVPDFLTEENQIEKEIERRLNVKIDYIKVPYTNYEEKLNITLASGEFPDLIYLQNLSIYHQFIKQGAVIPLDELLEKYGNNITRYWETDEEWAIRRNFDDGKIYGVTGKMLFLEANTLAIRQDWLEKLDLEIPETLTEWETVLRKFKDNDAAEDGNTIPWAGPLNAFRNAFGIKVHSTTGPWVVENNEYITMYEHPHYEEFLEVVRRFYSEGLIDPEFIIRTGTAYNELLASGNVGATISTADRISRTTAELRKIIPEATFLPVPPIKGPYGHQMIYGRSLHGTNPAVITIKARQPENVMKYIDWTFSDEGSELLNYGIEGVHHEKINGKPVLKDGYNTWATNRGAGMNKYTITFMWCPEAFKQCSFQGVTRREDMDDIQGIFYDGLYMNTPYIYAPAFPIISKSNTLKGADIWPELEEAEIKAIMGQISIEEFYRILNVAKENGLDEIKQETNEIWQRLQEL